uniref:Molybdate transporter 2 homolog n=1 Tax=Macrostomum lignano TaxID=282301 RepID=A0A1I8H276_9PLAT
DPADGVTKEKNQRMNSCIFRLYSCFYNAGGNSNEESAPPHWCQQIFETESFQEKFFSTPAHMTAHTRTHAPGDWLQGPYVYALYEHYKLSKRDILSSYSLPDSEQACCLALLSALFPINLVANTLFGFVAPFDMALIILVIMTVIVWLKWPENYGDASADLKKNFSDALTTVRTDRRVLCLGVVQSLFEGSMYCFVLEWTPALTPSAASTMSSGHAGKIPHGYIFAAYMVSLMIGGQLFSFCCNRSKPESFMRWVFGLSSVCLVQPALMRSDSLIPITFVGFLVFECCVGLFWPAIGTMRSKYVPDSIRATIMNLFRIPLNLVVVIILTQNFPIVFIFKCCVFFLIICCGIQFYLERLTRDEAPVESADSQTGAKSTENDQGEFQGIA